MAWRYNAIKLAFLGVEVRLKARMGRGMERTFISSTKAHSLAYRSLPSDRMSRSPVYLSTYLSRLMRSVLRMAKAVFGWWINLVLSLF